MDKDAKLDRILKNYLWEANHSWFCEDSIKTAKEKIFQLFTPLNKEYVDQIGKGQK